MPARARLRPDPAGQGAVGRRRRPGAAARRRAVRRAERWRPRAGVADVRSSWPRSKGCRARRPIAPSFRFPRTRSIRIVGWRRTSASRRRGPARCTRSPRHRPRRRCVGGGAAAACERARRGCWRRHSSSSRAGHRAEHAGELLVDAGFSREDPADEHGEFAIRGGIVDIFPAGETQPGAARVHRRHDRIVAHLRSGRRSDRSRQSIVPLRDAPDHG